MEREVPSRLGRSRTARLARLVWFGAAVVGALAGIAVLAMHLVDDPLADVRAYYDAGARLNADLPLYDQPATTNEAAFYRYPPLLAIAFRPIAALVPYEIAALAWGSLGGLLVVLTVAKLGARRFEVWTALGILGPAIGWALAVGQAQIEVTWLLAIGAPWAIALAANLKVLPVLVAVFWVGRRRWRTLGWFLAAMAGLVVFQLALEPAATIEYLRFLSVDQVGEVRNLSPYAISPILWAGLVIAGVLLALRIAPTRWGWGAAVTLSVLATPRLLVYMLMTLIAVLRPAEAATSTSTEDPPAASGT